MSDELDQALSAYTSQQVVVTATAEEPDPVWARQFAAWVILTPLPALEELAAAMIAAGHQAGVTVETNQGSVLARKCAFAFSTADGASSCVITFQITSTEGVVDVATYIGDEFTGDAHGITVEVLDQAGVTARAKALIVAALTPRVEPDAE